ncbi:MAG: hypothetical protein R2707_18965 [Acidimicrobiales bacterium]
MSGIDPTVVIERMARRLRADRAPHPVAGAVALAARGHTCLTLHEFAAVVDLPAATVRSAELGCVAFGELPSAIGAQAGETGADLLSLADLEVEWRSGPPASAAAP